MVRFLIARIPIAIRPTFWVTVVLLGLQNGLQGRELVAWTAAVFLAVLVHELGHAFAARRAGANFIEVELYFLGGVTMWSAPEPLSPLRRLGVAAAGSGVGILLGLVAILPLRYAPLSADGVIFAQAFVFAALVWGILNWVPIRALDGGVMVSSFFEWLMPNRGKLVAETVLFGFGVVGIAAAALFGQWFIAAIVGFFGLSGIGALLDAWRELRDERSLGELWQSVETSHNQGEFEAAATGAEEIVERATSAHWRNRGHEEALRNWYLAGVLDRAVEAGDAWEEAGHHASWVAVQAYLDAGRTMDVQRIAAARVAEEPVLAGPLAIVDMMLENDTRVDELVKTFPEPLATYLPMKVSDRIAPLDPYSRRRVAQVLDRLPDIPLVQRVAAAIEAGWGERAIEMIDVSESTPDLEALRAHALHRLGQSVEAESQLLSVAERAPTVTAQVVAIRTGHLDLAEDIGARLIERGGPALHVAYYNHACVASMTGRRVEAVERTGHAIDAGFTVVRSLNFDPDIAEIRQDPRFHALRTKAWRRQQIAFGNSQAQ